MTFSTRLTMTQIVIDDAGGFSIIATILVGDMGLLKLAYASGGNSGDYLSPENQS